MDHFDLHAPFSPTGDQPEAIAKLVQGIRDGDHEQTLLGVTGSGKTYTIANVIAQVSVPVRKPAAVAAPAQNAVTEPFPLVPAICTTCNCSCGLPRASSRA